MRCQAILVLLFLVSKSKSNILDLAMDFTLVESSGRIRVCNFITCWGIDNILLMKATSANFRCLTIVKSPTTSISDWFVPGIRQLFVVDLNCPDTEERLLEGESLGLFNDYVLWLVINEEVLSNGTSWMDLLENIYVTVLSEVYIANRVSEDKFEVMSVWRRDATERLLRENLGYWTKKEGVVFTGIALPSVRRANTKGRVFKAVGVIINDESLDHMYDLLDPQVDNPTKIYYTYWEHMVQAMNGRMEFIVAREWGENINGSFNGMVGYIERDEAEIPVSPLYINEDRLRFMRTLATGHIFRIKILFLSPPLSYKNNIYTLAFSSGVWYSCFLFFILFSILLYVVVHGEGGSNSGEYTRRKALTKSWTDIAMFNLATICQQDPYVEPKGFGGRLISLYLKILVLFVSVFYSASILILLQSSDRSITTLKALGESNIKVGSHDTPYNRFYIKANPDPAAKIVAAKIPDKTGYMTPEEGIKRVKKGFYAFNVNTATGYIMVREFFNEDDMCRLQELDESIMPPGNPMMAVRKDLPYRELMAIMFLKIFERGFVRRESLRKSAEKPPCEQSEISFMNIGLIDSGGAFQLLLSAYFISFAILIVELILFKRNQNKVTAFVQYDYYD